MSTNFEWDGRVSLPARRQWCVGVTRHGEGNATRVVVEAGWGVLVSGGVRFAKISWGGGGGQGKGGEE